jgi:hypothetical protein
MVVEFLGGPWDGERKDMGGHSLTIAVPLPPDVCGKPSRKPRDYTRIGIYVTVQAPPVNGRHFANWIGET